MNIYENEQPEGIIVQMGGQTPLNLSVPLLKAGCKILGTSPDSIDIAEDRKRCRALLDQLGIRQPESDTCTSLKRRPWWPAASGTRS
jgi:carbamoyl-phosphate synthase large subunit